MSHTLAVTINGAEAAVIIVAIIVTYISSVFDSEYLTKQHAQ